MKCMLRILLPILFFFSFDVFAVIVTKENFVNDNNISISGSASITESQYVKGHHWTKRTDTVVSGGSFHDEPFPAPMWAHSANVNLRFESTVSQRFKIIVNPVFEIWFDRYPVQDIENQTLYPFREHFNAAIAIGEGIYSFGDINKPSFKIEAGIFPFKYNENATNLGEYLFRSGCYPPFLTTNFDYPFATLSGFKFSSLLFNNLRQDLLLTTETQVQPMYDWSLSYLIRYSIPSFFSIGAGISFYRLFPISTEVTTPSIVGGQPNASDIYFDKNNDTMYYSFQGTKAMAQVSFDPKGFFPFFSGVFGKEDLKLYGEAAVLGIEDKNAYKWYFNADSLGVILDSAFIPDTSINYYGSIRKRMPIMFGFNVPAFKILDIVSLQAEWYGWNFKNALYFQSTGGQNAIPTPRYSPAYPKEIYIKDNWKWSIYIKKEISRHFSIIGQASKDHSRSVTYYEIYKDENEIFTKSDEWGWWMKVQYNF